MSKDSGQLEVRRLRAGSREHHLALHKVLDVEAPSAGTTPAEPVADMLAGVRRRAISIDLCFGVFQGPRLVSACIAVESAGRAALICLPSRLSGVIECRATTLVLHAVKAAAWERSVLLLEALTPCCAKVLAQALREGGFRYLTRLRYLTSTLDNPRPRLPRTARSVDWIEYAPECETVFQQAVESTYTQSLDCPELTGLRTMGDVLAGHRAAGLFDPALWWVARRGEESVGVLLLSRLPRAQGVEIVYMGVVPSARGTGVADVILERAVRTARRIGAKRVTLAVDERNMPARRLYTRWSFVEIGVRDAWIATSPGTRA